MSTPDFTLARDAFGKLVFTGTDGVAHVGAVPVRAFPIAAPDEGLSLIGPQGHELAWVPRLSALPAAQRELIEAELALREFTPVIERIREVSTFSVPSTWTVDTDRGPTHFVLKSEDDIRRLGNGRLLIAASQGLSLSVRDMGALDKHSRKLLERFL
ncbi:DUF1854 domain-containing protein [Aquabacterium sp.]|jgi:hypothetical protein|uniref:cyanophycin metabolism-associated DUF1854 family protein n=1 Tax=Aquabacterium sp. TaxID=1872578 RepID=UPI0025BE3BD4|nr:DUF1854 domain-containing protein [Aquabacterium sp.]